MSLRNTSASPAPVEGTQPHVSGPEDVRGEHEGQVEGRHLVLVLLPGGVVEQVQQQPEQRAVGLRQQLQQQLQRLHLPLLVGHGGLVAVLVKQRQVCKEQEAGGQRRREPQSAPDPSAAQPAMVLADRSLRRSQSHPQRRNRATNNY